MTLRSHLDLLKKAAALKILSSAVEPIHEHLEMLNTWIVAPGSSEPEEYFMLDGDDQELDEALLGVGFIACQAGITHIASRAILLATFCEVNGINALTGWVTKADMYKLGEPIKEGGPSKMLFLNAVANYFKHRDEWADTDWSQLKGDSKKTAETISHGGLSRHAKDNLRKATESLDGAILGAVMHWGAGVVAQAEKELAAHLS